ncbi:MAG: Panacea domain-containing protein [Candidatus Eremiobacterota bacterium]
MLIDHSKEKLYNAIIYFLKNTKHCGKTKLFKLLYYLDFLHFRETGKSVTNLDYYAYPFGPYPTDLGHEIFHPSEESRPYISIEKKEGNGDFTPIKTKKKFENLHFSKREMRILEQLSYIFRDVTAEDIIEISHLPNEPWDKTIKTKGEREKIDYCLAVDNTPKSLQIEEIIERLREREAIKLAFNE